MHLPDDGVEQNSRLMKSCRYLLSVRHYHLVIEPSLHLIHLSVLITKPCNFACTWCEQFGKSVGKGNQVKMTEWEIKQRTDVISYNNQCPNFWFIVSCFPAVFILTHNVHASYRSSNCLISSGKARGQS